MTYPYAFACHLLVLATLVSPLGACVAPKATGNPSAQIPLAKQASSAAQQPLAPDPLEQAKFEPGPIGTPLPPPTKAVGNKWPPEVKRFIDGLIELFGQHERPSLSLRQIETTLGVTLTPQPFTWQMVDASYRISGSELLNPLANPGLSEYRVGTKKKDGLRFHAFEFSLDPQRFCVSPYDLAIYTGNKYMPDPPLHGWPPGPLYPPTYEWGMFDRTITGRYNGQPKPGIALITTDKCILKFRAFTNTLEEIQP